MNIANRNEWKKALDERLEEERRWEKKNTHPLASIKQNEPPVNVLADEVRGVEEMLLGNAGKGGGQKEDAFTVPSDTKTEAEETRKKMDTEAHEGLYLAGNYGSYGWIAIPVEAGQTYTAVPVVATLLGTSLTYEEMVTQVGTFTCGVADTQDLNTGATVTVELCLTNPENPEEHLILNTTVFTLA